ncbi:MAG: hypothetical protein A2186_02305 [Candidatus Levybacteria bacterium RIFOXYA1_FULL_41_10]|nr:MAG: IlvB1 [Candidatus Levybacteria bacterium GW2011_GWA1_39_32]KKR49792.1 MAG: Acetolactate synthase large subunit [Candidatus Levybacteria bacterium GW2011_GWC1_40_19]KKR94294.1 MAG: IlvB1 [Candidatus Levybacteria bacterium GW2011_GWA2_41_15]KKS00677.1 MAG: IlvB1 [Candidatus Levybacteria bacterium GW2011_GWB1_41_21]OGH20990.1 MAG: hypothetical protein A2695_03080 [Candidatus Levybacteria bacterium RIFCSPHIGHO2_01_FULL_40_83]OGH26529.1 MAG: hypothetical protein A3D82_04200 [Candidatus Levy
MLKNYGIYPSQLQKALNSHRNSISGFLDFLLQTPTGPNHFTKALIEKEGKEKFAKDVAKILGVTQKQVEKAYVEFSKKNRDTIILSGAEAVSLLMYEAGIEFVFAYPGTSELVLCNSLLKTPNIKLVNGRGDKESAFMAAGGSMISPATTAAVLHGSRGLTNATGAIADAYRNEIGAVYLVGLPSIASAPFLPPHGERNLIKSIGNFVKFHTEITEFVDENDSKKEKDRKIKDFFEKVNKVIENAKSFPIGPTMIGLPQDAMEERWIPYGILKNQTFTYHESFLSTEITKAIAKILKNKKHPIILIDDFLFKTRGAKESLAIFAKKIQAPILQIRYLRGPMLFERLSSTQNPYFAGSYDNKNSHHQKLIKMADLIITIEDRNGYPRVIGQLPNCQKIAITSNPAMTKKNNYLKRGDSMLTGDVSKILLSLTEYINPSHANEDKILSYCEKLHRASTVKIQSNRKFHFMRVEIAEIFTDIFQKVKNPIVVDDSQMLGGLLFEGYDKFPENLRVFGDHGGFIGGGMALSAGLALVYKSRARIFCFLGDQSFVNGFQSLVSVTQEKIPITYIICNNGKSVSLLKQAQSADSHAFNDGIDRFLQNAPFIDYTGLSKELGIKAYKIEFDPESKNKNKKNPEHILRNVLYKELNSKRPVVIELVLPSYPEAWKGIWAIKGNDEAS